MSTEEQTQEEIRSMVDEAKNPKTFSIVNVLAERAYPKEIVEVFLDEETSYKAALVKEKMDELDQKTSDKTLSVKQRELKNSLIEEFEQLSEKISENKYLFHICGISEGVRERLLKEAKKKYPVEYEKSTEISALLGSNAEPREKPSPERDQLFTDLLWKEHVEKVEDPDGNVQENISYNEIRSLRDNLPLSASAKINKAIEKIRTSTAVFMMETGEDFLAKP